MPASRSRDYGLVLLASVLWGTSFPGTKVTVGTVDPLFLTFARMGLGALLGVVVLAGMRRLDLRVFREPLVWVLGAINAVGFDLQNEGILLTTATKTALLVNVNVVIIPALMVVFFREAMTRTISGILILLEVVVAAILSFVFLQDALSAYTVAGGAMILLGAFVVTRGESGMPHPATGGLAPVPQNLDVQESGGRLRP